MALASTARGTNTSNSSGTNNLTIAPSGNFAARSMPVLVVAYDNSGTSGADPFGTGSVTDSLGNVWTSRHDTLRDPGAASAGTVLRIFTCAMQFPLTTGTTITFTTQTATTAKVCALWEITAAAGQTAVFLATGTGAGNATTTPSVTTSSITSGDLVVGAVANEYGTAQTLTTPDADSTNGTWGTNQYTEIGTTTSGQNVTTQTKVTTGTGTQTYNLTMGTSTDWAAGWISVDEVSATQTLTLGLLDAGNALYAPSLASPSAYETDVLGRTGLKWYLPLDETSGSTVADWVVGDTGTFPLGLTLNDATDLPAGMGGGAPRFDIASSQYITIASHADRNLGDTFTLVVWFKLASAVSGYETFISKDSGGGTHAYEAGIKGDGTQHLYLAQADTAVIKQGATALTNDGLWHQFVVTKSGSTRHIYLDDVLDESGAEGDQTLGDSTSALEIGRWAGGANWTDGWLAHVQGYSVAWAQADVDQDWDAAQGTGGSQTLTLGLLTSTSALYAPTVLPQPVTVTLGLLTSASALYAPTLAPKNTLTLGLLTSTSSLFAPALAPQPVTVTLGSLDGANALYAPSLAAKYLISLGLLDAANALYAPSLTPKNLVSLGFLDASSALYAPTLAPQPVTITLGSLDASNALYAPSVSQTGAGSQSLTLGLLDAGPALYAPTLAPQPVTITLGSLDAANALYPPTLSPDQFVTLGSLDAANALYAPTLSQVAPAVQDIVLGLIDSGATTYAPTLLPQAVTIALGLLDGSRALYAPTLGTGGIGGVPPRGTARSLVLAGSASDLGPTTGSASILAGTARHPRPRD